MARHGYVFDYYSGECSNKTTDGHFSMRALITDGEPGAHDHVMESVVPEKCGKCDSDVLFHSENIIWPPTVELTVEDVKETFNATQGYVCLKFDINDEYKYRSVEEEQVVLTNDTVESLPVGDDGDYYVTCVEDEYYFSNSDNENPLEKTSIEMDDDFLRVLLNRYSMKPVSLDETPLKHATTIPTHFMGT